MITFSTPWAVLGSMHDGGQQGPAIAVDMRQIRPQRKHICQGVWQPFPPGQMQRLISTGNRDIDKVLSDLYEDIHWLLLVTGKTSE